MPIYEFQCYSCGLRFEKLYRRVTDDPEAPCTSCGEPSQRQVTAAAFKFAHTQGTRGALPPNTGTSDDWNWDKAIGRDAEEKWRKIEQRDKIKDTKIRDERREGKVVTRDHLIAQRDGSGEYRVMTEPERLVVNERRKAAFEVSPAVKKKAAKDKPQDK